MPSVATGLPFFRKRQTLESLNNERPQNLQSVYNIVRENIAYVLDHVKMLEHSVYGHEGSLDTEVKYWMPLINQVIRPARFSDLVNRSQLDAIQERIQDPTDRLCVDVEVIRMVYDLLDKIRQAVREGLAEDTRQLDRLRDFMHKYCQSFSATDGEAYLETATNYEKQKRELEEAITINLNTVTANLDAFEKDALKIHQFDYVMRETGEKAGCSQAAILLVFPAACHNVRNACRGLELWIDADANYAGYLQLDIAELAERRVQLEKNVHQLAFGAGEFEHRVKAIMKNIASCNADLARLMPKKKALETEEAGLREENRDVLVDLDIKEYRRQEMKMLGEEASEKFTKLTREIEALRTRKPTIDRKLAELRKKQDHITERQNRKKQLEADLDTTKSSLFTSRKSLRKAEVEVERADACLDRLREIQRLKTSPETLKKIFHGMPASPRHPTPHLPAHNSLSSGRASVRRSRRDMLDAVLHAVAQSIETEWIQLYYTLPFHPPRGDHTIDDDVDDINTRYLRQNTVELAKHSLAKWRRLHTRACAEDVRSALVVLRRFDILEKVDILLTPKPRPSVPAKKYRAVHFPKLPATPRTSRTSRLSSR